ncbi:MAG: NTP transferase domain-containing protein [Flavicella sp.]
MQKEHSKHKKMARRENGRYAVNELAFIGVKCSIITNLVAEISNALSDTFKIGYFDASHGKDNHPPLFDTYTFHPSGDTTIHKDRKENVFNERILFTQYDLLCVNGNHFEASQQIVLLDPEKEKSILKRIDQLTDIQFFVKTTEEAVVFDCLLELDPKLASLPIYDISDITSIVNHIQTISKKAMPVLNGLVLVGGKSTRMGSDKAQLDYHGIPQGAYAVSLLEEQGLETFVSIRDTQQSEFKNTIPDAFVDLGPFGGICSAFMKNPNQAYLVLATDLPHVNADLISLLLTKRNPKKIATAIKGKSKQFVEPLVTIWEPKAYPILLQYLSQGYSCPRKVLINSDVEIVEVDDYLIQNVNTPEEYKLTQEALKK